jgi:UrcA family protein
MTMNTMTTVNRFRTEIATALFGAFASSFAVLPAAADSFDAPTITVKYGDLDISNPHGAAVLYARIRAADENLCGPYDRSGMVSKMRKDACVSNIVANVVTKTNKSALSAVYSSKTGKSVSTTHLTTLQSH